MLGTEQPERKAGQSQRMTDGGRTENVLRSLGRPIEPHGVTRQRADLITQRIHSSRIAGKSSGMRVEPRCRRVVSRRGKRRRNRRFRLRATVTSTIVTWGKILQFNGPAIDEQLPHLRFIQNTPLRLVGEHLMEHGLAGHQHVGSATCLESLSPTAQREQHGQQDHLLQRHREWDGGALNQKCFSTHVIAIDPQ
jgi:hypothetical protein